MNEVRTPEAGIILDFFIYVACQSSCKRDIMRRNISFLAGSKFWHAGAFEVKKETNTDEGTNSLDVNISSDLLGVSEVRVRIVNRGKFYCTIFNTAHGLIL